MFSNRGTHSLNRLANLVITFNRKDEAANPPPTPITSFTHRLPYQRYLAVLSLKGHNLHTDSP